MMKWRKDANMKYTEMCIFIDQHVSQLNDPNCPPELANTIYNYLWLLVKALAIKKRMFNSFQDYDGYSFYAANRLYFALKRNLENQGKVIKGKEIKPIKSCLNYTKALLYPMKIEYLKEEYDAGKTEEEIAKRFDTFRFKQQLKESAWGEQGGKDQFTLWVQDTFQNFSKSVDNVLKRAPFAPDTLDYKKLKISIFMNVLANLKANKSINAEPVTVLLWKLPKSTSNYIKLFLKELGTDLKQVIMESYSESLIDDVTLETMLANPEGEFINHEE